MGSLGAMRDRKDYVEILDTIDFPSLIIHCKSDLASPIQNAEWMHQKIKNSKIYFSDTAGHMVNLEDEENVNKAILDFLRT